MRKYAVMFNGTEYTRTTEHEYPYASYSSNDYTVRFHKTHKAARRAAGAFGEVKSTERVY
jgi:hypothetical protein